jgi:hypothetical protein
LTKRELSGADQARRLYVIMGRPSEESLELMIKKGKIINNLVTIMNFRDAKKVYGKDLGTIKGKTARQKAPHVLKEPNDDPEEKQVIVLSVDIMNFGSTFFLLLFQELSDVLPQLQYQIGRRKLCGMRSSTSSMFIGVRDTQWKKWSFLRLEMKYTQHSQMMSSRC